VPALFRRSAGLRRYAGAFGHRDYRLLVLAFLIDSSGSWASSVVVAVYLFDRTGSVTWLAAIAAARWIPGLLIGPFAGVLADRYDRRTVMAISATASGIVAVGYCVVIGVGAPVGLLLLLAAVSAVTDSPYRPAAGALTPEVVGEQDLAAANGLFAALENLVVVLGPAFGGLLLLLHRPVVGTAVNAASFFIAATIAWSLAVRSHGDAEAGRSAIAQFVDGVRALRAAPTAAVLLVFAALDTLLCGTFTVVYIPISEHLGTGSNGYSYLLAAAAVGGVAGAAVADRLSAARRLAPVIVGGLVLQALPYALTPFTSSPVVGSVLQAVSGVGMVFVDVLAITAMQREIESGLLSRVLGLLGSVGLLASVIGSFGMSGLFALTSYRVALLVLGLGVAAAALALAPLVISIDRRAAGAAAQLDDRVRVLEQVPLFGGASRPVLQRIAAAVSVEEIPAGRILIREGDPADAMWILANGTLAINSRSGDVRHVAIPDVTAPDVVGEIGVLRGIPRTATVTAAGPVRVWRLPAEAFLTATEPEPRSLSLVGPVAARLARTHPKLIAPETDAAS
jgi:MFS family permease